MDDEIWDAPRKIVTENVYPPIPIRRFDWCAYYDGNADGRSLIKLMAWMFADDAAEPTRRAKL